jgi:hypothetical protein
MVLGMSLANFTLLHVVISLVGIGAGLLVLYGLITSRRFSGWTAIFLATTILTSVTGFLFPFERVLPSHIFGVISLVLLAIAVVALYGYRLAGRARWIYVASAVAALYLNVFVGVVQSFLKVSFLQPLAPTQSELPFIVAQGLTLVAFAVLGFVAVRGFRPDVRAAA